MNKSLLALAVGGLAIGMTEFSMMGLLSNVAEDLHISIPQAGNFISIYALGVVIGAPLLVMLSNKFAPHKVLMTLMLMFSVFHTLFVISPDYTTLLITRFVSGLPHGAFFGVGSVVATQLAKPGKEAQAVAIMFAGLTTANLIGVPLSTYIGQEFSWRTAYGLIASLGIITTLTIWLWIPKLEADKNTNTQKQLSFFKTKTAWVLVALISIGTGGLFAWISYIKPMMMHIALIPEKNIPIIMTLVGLGMFLGNFVGGKIADTFSPSKAVIFSFSAMTICLIVVYYTVHIQWLAYVMALVTGLVAFTMGSPLQMMLIKNAKGSEMLAASAGQACFNIGNALGAYLGGIPIALGLGYNSPEWVGAGMAVSGAILAFLFLKMQQNQQAVR
ncbi:MFS transporter [Myroides indicus]|uniref:DHA1 family arabinose polymer transporter-like MFS transporter n=1 Tax=Myroides indicus TaxID=1323422 RepID=A0A4R7ESW2_9FLAO|nr:MFS transporter [Myroides indicus]TDS56618.1 DHA1 family arabinose polymer transporter-like MFS transporter [Myroides indicus]